MAKKEAVHVQMVCNGGSQVSLVSISFSDQAVGSRVTFCDRFEAIYKQQFGSVKASYGMASTDCVMLLGVLAESARLKAMLIAIANELDVRIYILPNVQRSEFLTDGLVPASMNSKVRPSN